MMILGASILGSKRFDDLVSRERRKASIRPAPSGILNHGLRQPNLLHLAHKTS